MSPHKQLEYNNRLFIYRVLNREAPECISNLYSCHPSRCSNSRNYQLSLPKPRTDILKTSISLSQVPSCGNLPLIIRSCHSLSSFKRKLPIHLEAVIQDRLNCDRKLLGVRRGWGGGGQRQTDRDRDTQREAHRERERERQVERERDKNRDRERQRVKETDRHTERLTERQTDRQRERERFSSDWPLLMIDI